MAFSVTHRYGSMERDPSLDTLPALLAETRTRLEDREHADVAVTHESEWCLSTAGNGRVVFENLEDGHPRHLIGVDDARLLELWVALAHGNFDRLEREPWQPGYG
jgi:hypothetical protein